METPKLKISSKKLHSGRFQVNFSTQSQEGEFHGYLLAEPRTPLREVVEKIGRHVEAMRHADRYLQRNLYSLTNREATSGRILIFRTEKPSDKKRAA